MEVGSGGRTIHGNVLLHPETRLSPFVAVQPDDSSGVIWYGQRLLCFQAIYLGKPIDFCYLRWLGKVADVAQAAGHDAPDPADMRYPFPTYRWDLHPGMRYFRGHPHHGEPHDGVVAAECVLHRAPIVPSPADPLDSPNPLFILATDMWERF